MSAAWLRDPAAIYAQSFATIRAECDLAGLDPAERDVALRVVHACGMVEVAAALRFAPGAAAAGRAALEGGAPILADCRMVAAGIIARRLPAENPILSLIGATEVATEAQRRATTRSAAQIELWRPHLAGSVVVIGNAPTALFRLLEVIGVGAARPAAILGFPVGFVGAAESKAALAATDLPWIVLPGRRGGSAMAAAALNALAAPEEAAR